MSRTPDSRHNRTADTASALAVVAAALTDWPTTLRLAVICTALSAPAAAGLALYLLLR